MTGWSPESGGPLRGLRVAVCGSGAAVRHAGRLLASLGAVAETGEDGWREADGVIDASGAVPSTVDIPVVRTVDTTALEDWASSGAMMLTGRRDGPPLRCPGQPASLGWGALLATELLARVGGRAVMLPGPRVLAERAALAGLHRNAPCSADGRFVVPAAPAQGEPDWPIVLNGLVRRALSVERPGLVPRRHWHFPATVVVDLTSCWAGALCGHLLTLVGARVIKVEDPARPDPARNGPPEFFDLLHAGQESVSPGERGLDRLLRKADIVLEDGEGGVWAAPDVALPDWAEDNAGRRGAGGACWVRIDGGSGDEAAAAVGLVAFDAEAGVPAPCGDAIAEPLAGVHAALAAVACRLGGGRWVAELPLRAQAAAALMGSLEPGVAPSPAPPVARRPAGRAPEPGADTARVARELGLG
ncbi:CoA-transferase family III [Amycolatopsis sacchari]|uniref:CoA-transferase family III n=1 Tax=Amycolatopsis sacchari TaxID=115433 RepID=A0A1I3XFM2_9PSEU|nr:CoA transferase [Amycolatopsis sacchari]SFK18323.1 CoA-transferase family III [Amycolatopsis sacchari]